MRATVVALALLAGCAHLEGFELPARAERSQAMTDDGVALSLVRYRPAGRPTGRPVLLCHGIGANGRNLDLDERTSLARWFAAQGREAWTLSLRGTGDSAAPTTPIFFDDYWDRDLPAAIAHVRRISGAEAVDFVGHSMGGMAMYAYLAQGGQGVAAAATLGSPTRFDFGGALEGLIRDVGGAFMVPGSSVPTPLLSNLLAPLEWGWDDSPMERFFYVPGNTSARTFNQLLVYGTAPIAGGTARQLGALFTTGRFTSKDGAIDLRANMARITTPVLVVAARLDRIGVAPAVKDGYRALGGPKEWLLIAGANGPRHEYGHMDLVLGERAAEEVWSKLLSFFDRHARKEP